MPLIQYLYMLLPIAMGIIVIKTTAYYSKKEFSARSISPSYFASIALLFALFASLIFSEVWGRINRINQLMLTQANSLRGILRLTEHRSATAVPFQNAVQEYIRTVKVMEQERRSGENTVTSNQTFQPIYRLATDSTMFWDQYAVQQAVLNKAEELRESWFERIELMQQRILPEKLLVLFLMGFFTQFSIAFSHLGNERAIRDTVWLFSLSFCAAVAILLTIDNTAISREFLSLKALNDVH